MIWQKLIKNKIAVFEFEAAVVSHLQVGAAIDEITVLLRQEKQLQKIRQPIMNMDLSRDGAGGLKTSWIFVMNFSAMSQTRPRDEFYGKSSPQDL
jgi:hypothetical protein